MYEDVFAISLLLGFAYLLLVGLYFDGAFFRDDR
jgi:hypothetical protein